MWAVQHEPELHSQEMSENTLKVRQLKSPGTAEQEINAWNNTCVVQSHRISLAVQRRMTIQTKKIHVQFIQTTNRTRKTDEKLTSGSFKEYDRLSLLK